MQNAYLVREAHARLERPRAGGGPRSPRSVAASLLQIARGGSGGGAPIRTQVRTLLKRLREEGTVVRDYLLEDTEGSFLVRLR